MRGPDHNQSAMFCYLSPESCVPQDHPLRSILRMGDQALRKLSPRLGRLYSRIGRRSIPPEKLLKAWLLQVLFSVRSERLLMEYLRYNLLFRWFVGLNVEEKVWDATVFSKNRARLWRGDIARAFFEAVLALAREQGLLSDEHFTVDGTLLEAWASQKSYPPKEAAPTEGTGSRGEVLLRDTHASQTDPDARLYRKSAGGEFKLCYLGHVLMENRHGLPVAARVTEAITDAEWEAALEMLATATKPGATVGADAGYDWDRFVTAVRELHITPHVAQHTHRSSSIDGRTTRHAGYPVSLKKRKRLEQIFGWLKTTGLLRKLRHRGQALVPWTFTLALAAYNLVRMRNLSVQAA